MHCRHLLVEADKAGVKIRAGRGTDELSSNLVVASYVASRCAPAVRLVSLAMYIDYTYGLQ